MKNGLFKKTIINLGIKIGNNRAAYYILNFTWGILTTLLGFILLFILLPFGKIEVFNGTLYLRLKKYKPWGFSIGTVFFVGKDANQKLKQHEYGHTIQNAIFGPFMPFFVLLPSVIRFWYIRYTANNKSQYDSIWFEGTATIIGAEVIIKTQQY